MRKVDAATATATEASAVDANGSAEVDADMQAPAPSPACAHTHTQDHTPSPAPAHNHDHAPLDQPTTRKTQHPHYYSDYGEDLDIGSEFELSRNLILSWLRGGWNKPSYNQLQSFIRPFLYLSFSFL